MNRSFLIIPIILLTLTFGCKKESIVDGPELNPDSTSGGLIIVNNFEDSKLGTFTSVEGGKATLSIIESDTLKEGTKAMSIKASKGWNAGGYGGFISFPASDYSDTSIVFPVPSGTSETFINFWCFGTTANKGNQIQITVEEDEDLDGKISSYDTNQNPSEEDFYSTTIAITWSGWKLIRLPYSSLNLPDVGAMRWGGGGGNKTPDPDKIHVIKFGLLNSESSPIDIVIDNLVLTTDEPYSVSN
jgi:hypothetical protein